MDTTKVSSKYQIVIPKAARQKLGIAAGQRLAIKVTSEHIILEPLDPLAKLQHKYGQIWGQNPATYVRQQRQEWQE